MLSAHLKRQSKRICLISGQVVAVAQTDKNIERKFNKKTVIFRSGAAGAAAVAPAKGRAARGLLPEAAGVALSRLLLPPDRAGARARPLLQRGGAQLGIQQV